MHASTDVSSKIFSVIHEVFVYSQINLDGYIQENEGNEGSEKHLIVLSLLNTLFPNVILKACLFLIT